MSETKIQNTIVGLDKSINTLSGALYTNVENLKSPIEKLVTAFDTSSKKTEELTKGLVFWTKIMAIAIIIQALAVIGQIIAIILTNSN